jgi:hypothetical protein
MGLGPIAGLDSILSPVVRKTEQTVPRFEVEATPRAGDEPSSSRQQNTASSEHKDQATEDRFETAAEEDNDTEVVSQISEESHDWFV